MKNVIKNDDGTLDLLGLSKVEAFTLLVLTGNTCTSLTDDVYTHLKEMFPDYDYEALEEQLREKANPSTFCDINDLKLIKEAAEKLFKKHEIVNVKRTSAFVNVSALPRRDSKGRFMTKKWVARFVYPSSNYPYNNVSRAVIVEKNSDGRKNPSDPTYLPIKGRDLARSGQFRNFTPYKIVGPVRWSREYVE